jgi:hypothetical protein
MAQMLSTENVVDAIELLRSQFRAQAPSGLVFSGGTDVADAVGYIQRWVTVTRPGCLPKLVVLDEQSVTVALDHDAQPYWQELLGLGDRGTAPAD